MDAVAVAFLTLQAILVGMIAIVMLQLHHALRKLDEDIRDARQRLEPMLDRIGSSQLATSVAMAVAAGVRAYREHAHSPNGNGSARASARSNAAQPHGESLR